MGLTFLCAATLFVSFPCFITNGELLGRASGRDRLVQRSNNCHSVNSLGELVAEMVRCNGATEWQRRDEGVLYSIIQRRPVAATTTVRARSFRASDNGDVFIVFVSRRSSDDFCFVVLVSCKSFCDSISWFRGASNGVLFNVVVFPGSRSRFRFGFLLLLVGVMVLALCRSVV